MVSVDLDMSDAARADWVMVQLPRRNGPPLRFKGRKRFHWTRADLFVSMWERKRGGVAVSYSLWIDGEMRPDAALFETLTDMAEHLESLCADPWALPAMTTLPGLPLTTVMRRMQYDHQFPLLVGDALASLDPFLLGADQSQKKGH